MKKIYNIHIYVCKCVCIQPKYKILDEKKNKKRCHINNIDPFLTSAVHHFPDVSGGHDVVGAQVISNLPSNGHDDSHHKVRKSRKYSYLEERKTSIYIVDQRPLVASGPQNTPRMPLQCATLLISKPNTSSKYAGWLMRSK